MQSVPLVSSKTNLKSPSTEEVVFLWCFKPPRSSYIIWYVSPTSQVMSGITYEVAWCSVMPKWSWMWLLTTFSSRTVKINYFRVFWGGHMILYVQVLLRDCPILPRVGLVVLCSSRDRQEWLASAFHSDVINVVNYDSWIFISWFLIFTNH